MNIKCIYILFFLILLYSCRSDSENLGVSTYHPAFLWVKADTTFVEKALALEFSDDAVESNSYASLVITDINHNAFAANYAQIFFNDTMVNNGFEVNSNNVGPNNEAKLKIRFLPNTKPGKQFGYLKVLSHDLDRINETHIKNGGELDIFKWEITFQKKMNPLQKKILIILSLIVIVLLLWLTLFRRLFFPVFPKFKKMVLFGNINAQNINFTGAREVVFTSRIVKQGLFDRIFKGKILYISNPVISDEFKIKPKGRNLAFVIDNTLSYKVRPNPIPQNGIAEIENIKTKIIIKLH